MNLYFVYNGWTGYSAVYIPVIADSEENAKEIAREQYKKESEKYGEGYYSNLNAELIIADTSKCGYGDISD